MHRLECPTDEGRLEVVLGPRDVRVTVAGRSLHVTGKAVTLTGQGRRENLSVDGVLVCARDVPQEDFGIWIERPTGMRRIFGVAPVSLLETEGLAALAAFDRTFQRIRTALAELAGDVVKAIEIGGALGKLLVADRGERHVIYVKRLFRGGARVTLEVFPGRVVVHDGKRIRVAKIRSRYGVIVSGDFVRFASPDGEDLARVSLPWLSIEDRDELARRIGQLVEANDLTSPSG